MNGKKEKVVIVGGGLVGPVCALYMAKRGYDVSLYEYRHDPRELGYIRGRSINLAASHRARRALRDLGIEDAILRVGIPMKGRFLHVPRNVLNEKLLYATKQYPNLQLFFNHKLIDVQIDKGLITFIRTDTNATVEVKADLVVGADGAHSTLRKCVLQKPLFDFSQTYVNHGYVELSIAPEFGKQMEPNHLHIWPRGNFMMIALPNYDNSWTLTLFMPFEKFYALDADDKVLNFFYDTFPDSVPLIGEKQLVKDFFRIPPSALISVKCNKYDVEDKVLLIGDAAHAIVPFYGQGMNAGFEDCTIFNEILDECNDNVPLSLKLFSTRRKNDAHAICDLALYNYVEMRDLVTRPSYKLRKFLDDFLNFILPDIWVPLYNSISFTEMNYNKCINNRRWQDKILMGVSVLLATFIVIMSFQVVFL
ncbi:hypothetical protein RN001_004692 [Aquatica leii]|uniref:Kynurenine 3-monooxygenase n=1 Tax=Aquatica leii TaxID=1421715 RepID=A0AAN7QJR9_9COLE|nr:hypothetical protein RN001_004692 [Aquatica leii]